MAKLIVVFAALTCLLLLTDAQRFRGHWEKTWDVPSSSISNANLGFAFSGWVDIRKALDESRRVHGRLHGLKIITIGGGNENGAWTAGRVREVIRAIDRGTFRGYRGLAFDVEEGHSGLSRLFQQAFRTAKRKGLMVVVTVPHTAPYGISDRRTLTWRFITSRYVDVLSPMLYPSDSAHRKCHQQGAVDPRISQGVPWWWFRRSRAAVVPSIWRRSQYGIARRFLRSQGVRTQGYIVWCR